MGIYQGGFERAVQNDGLSSTTLGNWRNGLSLDGSAFAAYDFSVTSGSTSNPATQAETAWDRSGERILTVNEWGIWTSSGTQTIGALDVEVSNGSGGFQNFARIDGNDLPLQIGDATDASLETESNPNNGALSFVRPGLGQTVLNGLSSITAYYVLMDSGSPIGDPGSTVNEGGSAPSWTYNSLSTVGEFTASADVVFSNSSGTTWNVTGIEVRANSETGDTIFQDTSVSATVADGGSVTFTDITLTVDGFV